MRWVVGLCAAGVFALAITGVAEAARPRGRARKPRPREEAARAGIVRARLSRRLLGEGAKGSRQVRTALEQGELGKPARGPATRRYLEQLRLPLVRPRYVGGRRR